MSQRLVIPAVQPGKSVESVTVPSTAEIPSPTPSRTASGYALATPTLGPVAVPMAGENGTLRLFGPASLTTPQALAPQQQDAGRPASSAPRYALPFIPKDLPINSWAELKPYFDDLLNRPVNDAPALEQLILDYSATLAVVYEAYAWAYINQSRYTNNEDYTKRLDLFDSSIMPEVSPAANAVNERVAKHVLFNTLPTERYGQLQRILTRQLEMYNEKNVPLEAKLAALATEYGQTVGSLSAEVDGKELTIQQAKALLRGSDRALREKAWTAIQKAYAGVKPKIDALYDEMIKLRHEVALNAGYANYRDYAHKARMRFDYSVEDTAAFRDAIEKHVVPLATQIYEEHRVSQGLSKDDFRPWDAHWRDMAANPGEAPLKPFSDADELKAKAINAFTRLKPEYGDNLRQMDQAGLFDLESRPFKQPGGYNYPLSVTGMPFIFMNSAGTHGDVETMVHEGGHAMHTFRTNTEPLVQYQETPAEMAETASMGMELLTMKFWDEYYKNPDDLKRAQREQLEKAILFLPWCAVVDGIQQWVYTHPVHTAAERDAVFKELMHRFGLYETNFAGFEDYMITDFLMQSHIFTMPFYYIEYGIAQLGALQVYRNYVNDPSSALNGYDLGLSLGYSKGLPEIWKAMGIEFDFSAGKIRELMGFVGDELEKRL